MPGEAIGMVVADVVHVSYGSGTGLTVTTELWRQDASNVEETGGAT